MLAVTEGAAGEEDGEVRVVVGVGVAHVAAVEDHGRIEQAPAAIPGAGEALEELPQ